MKDQKMSEQGILDTLKMLASTKLQATTGDEHTAWEMVWITVVKARYVQHFNELLIDQMEHEERNRDEFNGKIIDDHKLIYVFMVAFIERSFPELLLPQYKRLEERLIKHEKKHEKCS
jgi:hypothetical protein